MLENLLATCGLNNTEQKIFSYLLEKGTSLAGVISKRLNIKRPTVYAALDSLLRIGLLTKQKRKEVTYFATVPVQIIPEIFEQQAKNKFEEIKGATKLLETKLQPFQNQNFSDNPIFENITIESIEAVYAQMEDALLGGNFCAIFNPQKAVFAELKNVIARSLKETAKTKAHIRELAVAGPECEWYKSHIQNPNHILKEIPADSGYISDMILLKGSVFLLDYSPKNEVAIKITHQNHYKSMMSLFEMLWEKY